MRRWLPGHPFAGLFVCGGGVAIGLVYVVAMTGGLAIHTQWSRLELQRIASLSISRLPAVPPDPSDRFADSLAAARLGHSFFFDTRLSADDRVSCATCHRPDRFFQDGLPHGHGIGVDRARTPSLVAAARSPWLDWDGSADSLWGQATVPLEDPVEMGGDRAAVAHTMARSYRRPYQALFGPLPADLARLPAHAGPYGDAATRAAWRALSPADRTALSRVLSNVAKALEAYERRIAPGPARFDRYAAAVLAGHYGRAGAIYSGDEMEGLRLFIGPAGCISCHNGPLFSNGSFENIGVPPSPGRPPEAGRLVGVRQVLASPFNGAGRFSDAPRASSVKLQTVARGPALAGQFRTPSLRDVAAIAPYMHAGQFATLGRVMDFYSNAPIAPLGRTLLRPLGLTAQQKSQLVAFLRTLTGPLATERAWLAPPR